ncbi:hypothetical protein B0H11DRAFT_2197878 [Mycena galericulata]|nr:hypothetical protein B0H11DRAFT_2197878 [Mycena galericulata]
MSPSATTTPTSATLNTISEETSNLKARNLREEIRRLKDRIRSRSRELSAVRKDYVAFATVNKNQLIQLSYAEHFVQDTVAKIHQNGIDFLEVRKRFDALKAEELNAEAQEQELRIQRERLFTVIYPDASAPATMLTPASLSSARMTKPCSPWTIDILRSRSGPLGGGKPFYKTAYKKYIKVIRRCLTEDAEPQANRYAFLLDYRTESEIKEMQIQIAVNSTVSTELCRLRDTLQIKIALEEAKLNQIKEELTMRSMVLDTGRVHLQQWESHMGASQSVLFGRQTALRRRLAAACHGFGQCPQEMEREQILNALGLTYWGYWQVESKVVLTSSWGAASARGVHGGLPCVRYCTKLEFGGGKIAKKLQASRLAAHGTASKNDGRASVHCIALRLPISPRFDLFAPTFDFTFACLIDQSSVPVPLLAMSGALHSRAPALHWYGRLAGYFRSHSHSAPPWTLSACCQCTLDDVNIRGAQILIPLRVKPDMGISAPEALSSCPIGGAYAVNASARLARRHHGQLAYDRDIQPLQETGIEVPTLKWYNDCIPARTQRSSTSAGLQMDTEKSMGITGLKNRPDSALLLPRRLNEVVYISHPAERSFMVVYLDACLKKSPVSLDINLGFFGKSEKVEAWEEDRTRGGPKNDQVIL